MINKVLLSGDSFEFVQHIENRLEQLNQQTNIHIELCENVSTHQLAADEVVIFLTKEKKIAEDLLATFPITNAAYVTAIPDNSVLDHIANTKCIATQRHLLNVQSNGHISLGDLKNNINYSEPFIRESSIFIFDMDAIRSGDVCHEDFSYPSGIFSEDATQMFRYAGMNELNRSVIIANCTPSLTTLISQLIWYFSEAAALRFPDHPYFTNSVNEYIVNVDSLDLSISFYKSKVSGRWWVKVPDIKENKWKPCSYNDYQNACEDNLSTDLLEIISAVE